MVLGAAPTGPWMGGALRERRARSDGDWNQRVGRRAAVGLDAAAVGEKFAGVLENDHAVAEEAPPLLRVAGDDAGRVAVHCVGTRTGGLVLTHFLFSPMWVLLRSL